MSKILPVLIRQFTLSVWSFYLLQTLTAAESTQSIQTVNPFGQTEKTLQALDANKQSQLQAARSWSVFHDFKFSDRYSESGIRFENKPVDDGSRDYKAVHYDHGTGISVADVDGDGLLDIYFVNQLGGNQLWRNRGKGQFENITVAAGVGLGDKICVAASFGDIDNDGQPDLIVTTVRMGNILFRNTGNGHFQDITVNSGLNTGKPSHSSGATFFDFDSDGLIDLFIANVGVYTRNEKGRGGFFLGRSDAFQGWQFPARSEQSVLYKNRGGGRFEDVSAKMGLQHRGWSGDATFCDLNKDGFPDLYVPSMSGVDRFYVNDRGQRFIDKTAEYFPKTPWGTMGVKFFDYNLDGLMDLYLTDMHSDMTSSQIKEGDSNFNAQFDKQKSDAWCAINWTPEAFRSASNSIFGNAFYQNQGHGKLTEVSATLGVETYWPWGVSVADFNADGYEDLFVTAGMGYPLRYAINSLLLNQQGQRFVDSEFVLGIEPRLNNRIEKEFFTLDCSGEDKKHPLARGRSGLLKVIGSTSSRSSVAFDVDADGDLDLITNEWSDHPQVLMSSLSLHREVHFLKIRLVGTVSNRDGLDATVTVHCGAQSYVRFHDGKSGYLSQSLMPLYFGLDTASKADRIEVRWPSGKLQTLSEGIPINALLTITESR
ncbi:MAG: CRTAC1 family protein [Pedosphaera sp.]|nr:CRTAC1 family protein [Pedosphaera sp.]